MSTATVTTLAAGQQLGSVEARAVRRMSAEALRTYLAAARNATSAIGY